MKVEGNKYESFKKNSELRGICASDKYIYVIERAKHVLCLEYVSDEMGGTLQHIDQVSDCSPYAIAHCDGKIYCSRSKDGDEFYIAEVTHDAGKLGIKDLFRV